MKCDDFYQGRMEKKTNGREVNTQSSDTLHTITITNPDELKKVYRPLQCVCVYISHEPKTYICIYSRMNFDVKRID